MFDTSLLISSSDNTRNITVNIVDSPDTYPVRYVLPLMQVPWLSVSWQTNGNTVSDAAIEARAKSGLVKYLNSLSIGQDLNILVINRVFIDSISDIIPEEYITSLSISVSIQTGLSSPVLTQPEAGTQIIKSHPEGYWQAISGYITS